MASCATGQTSRVYDKTIESVCAFIVGTWGHLFTASKKKNTKNTCEPTNFPYFAIVGPLTFMGPLQARL